MNEHDEKQGEQAAQPEDLAQRSHDGRDDDEGRAPGRAGVPGSDAPIAGGGLRWGAIDPELMPFGGEAPPDPEGAPQQGGGRAKHERPSGERNNESSGS